ncbi:VOC family protein [Novosphingobium sp.]|uniref:VOC family protein n=1 Tax=Novosphingobium sp. TaxID=1874826 RepID=UPI0025FAFF00|nr:VOC family protein [Novosphingobium sp.]
MRAGWLALSLMFAGPALADTPAIAPTGSIIGPALHVSALVPALHFYVDGLGMTVNMTMGPADRRETILGFGRDPSQPGIILLADTTRATPQAIGHAFGYDRLVLRITDLDATAARLKAAGFAPSPIRDVAMGYRMMLATDADGYKLELVERKARPK